MEPISSADAIKKSRFVIKREVRYIHIADVKQEEEDDGKDIL